MAANSSELLAERVGFERSTEFRTPPGGGAQARADPDLVAEDRSWRSQRGPEATHGRESGCQTRHRRQEGLAAGMGGEGGIRTHGSVATTHDFQSCTFGLSVTSPIQVVTVCRLSSVRGKLAERVGFEPTVPLRAHLISNQAPSASRSPLQKPGQFGVPRLVRREGGLASVAAAFKGAARYEPSNGPQTRGFRLRRLPGSCGGPPRSRGAPSHVVVRCLLRDDDVVHVALAEALAGDADELALLAKLLDVVAAGVAHAGTQAPDQLR